MGAARACMLERPLAGDAAPRAGFGLQARKRNIGVAGFADAVFRGVNAALRRKHVSQFCHVAVDRGNIQRKLQLGQSGLAAILESIGQMKAFGRVFLAQGRGYLGRQHARTLFEGCRRHFVCALFIPLDQAKTESC